MRLESTHGPQIFLSWFEPLSKGDEHVELKSGLYTHQISNIRQFGLLRHRCIQNCDNKVYL